MSLLVGLSGYARSGKDSAATVLTDGSWVRASFADKLREFLLALDPLVPTDPNVTGSHERLSSLVAAYGWETCKDNLGEVRSLLQRCGTEAGRKVLGEDVWVNAVLSSMTSLTPIVVTDVRFPNEANAIVKRGGMVLRINRPGIGPKANADGEVHASETALDDWRFDYVLQNDGTLEELHAEVLFAVGQGMVA